LGDWTLAGSIGLQTAPHEGRIWGRVTPVGRRYVWWAALLIGTLVGAAGCSGGSGKPAASATATNGLPTPSSTSRPVRTTTTTSRPATTTPKATATIAVPKVEKSAQGAVDAYIDYLRAAVYVEADPGEIRRGDMNKLLGAKARTGINASLDALAKAGIAYRGTPPDPRVKVIEVASSKLVLLSSCPLQSKSDPYRQVVVATGKPVKVSDRRPGPPYLRTLTMFHNKKRWVLIKFSDDTSRTCTG
jgi:hypothetical protein